jgi:hypothetical protein
VNTHAEYRRHGYRPPTSSLPTWGSMAMASELARHGDPSLPRAEGQATRRAVKRVAWVRPTELSTYLAPMVGRGVDLQAELIRRARRTPATSTRALHRGTPHTPSPTPPRPGHEGMSL